MASLKAQGRKRLKYKELPTALVLASSVAANPEPQPSSLHSPASDHDSNPKPSGDSAVDMGGKNKPQWRKKQQHHALPGDDQELVFRGRGSANPSSVTNASSTWRWDPALGALISNTSGASYQPPPAANVSNPDAASVVSTKLEKSTWATKPATTNDWNAPSNPSWDTGHPPYPSKAHLDAQPQQNSKNQARSPTKPYNHNGKGRKPRESPWIKDSLIPKGDPNRHKMRWASSESSSSDSNRASSGWGTRKKRDDDVANLTDWGGGIGPASIDWDSRSKFRDHQSAAKIENWLDQNLISIEQVKAIRLTAQGSNFPFATTRSNENEFAVKDQGDIAPRYWSVPQIDGKSAKFFWVEHIDPRGDDVKPMDKEDLQGAKPWWETYVDDEHSVLKLPEQPDEAGIDPKDESTEERRAREHDHGAAHAGENLKAATLAKRDAHRKRTLAKRERAHKVSGTHEPSSANAIKPGLNMFLRMAAKEDMVQLRDIYNRYIDNAYVVPETDRLTENDMLHRWQAIRNAKLPFIVACQRGEVIKARNRRFNSGEDMITPDRVIGFACAADWSDGTCIFRPTVKLEVFVHMEQYMKHIGSCLTDKILGLLDPKFVERGGYDTCEDLERVEPARAVSNVLVRYSYEANKTDKLKWVSRWLETRYGFEQVADLQGVARKFDEQLNLAMLQRTIG